MATSRPDRLAVFAGIATAWVLSLSFVWLGAPIAKRAVASHDWSAAQAAAFAMMVAALTLIAGIGWAARTRNFSSNIDGSRPEAGSHLDITLRYISNTTEQLVLFSIACICAAIIMPDVARWLLPLMGCWFVLARAAFFFGYQYHPLARSVGFPATFHPTIVLTVYTLWRLFQ